MKSNNSKSVSGRLCPLAAAFVLSACGMPQASPQANTANSAIPSHRVGRAASMAKVPSTRSLLYVATSHGIIMLSYPDGKPIGTIASYARSPYVCSDPNSGNVFVAEGPTIKEYAPGGTTPIATLSPPSGYANLSGCSVDFSTGDLAVTVYQVTSSSGAVLVYQNAQGHPAVYQDAKLKNYIYCAYDGSGNLFVDGISKKNKFRFAELPKGSGSFTDISLNEDIGFGTKIEWDGAYLTVRDNGLAGSGDLYQISISGSTGIVTGSTHLKNVYGDAPAYWIQGGTVVAPFGQPLRKNNQRLGFWNYPAGGAATQILSGLTKGKRDILNDVTISVSAGP